jgi:SsrA-binding protein
MATKEASSSKKPSVPSSGKSKDNRPVKISPKAAAAATRIADNKKAMFNYHIEERFEAGMVLQGWLCGDS